ncbi:GNAT family N-acetyltransferase [Sphingobium chungangianum]
MALSAHFSPLPDLAALAPRWRALEAASDSSFFLGWTWTSSWLESYAVRPDLLSVTDEEGRDIALALTGHAMQPRLLGRCATLSLNQSGDAAADRPYVEYNGLLAQRGLEAESVQAFHTALKRRTDWRALRLSGITPGSPLLGLRTHRATRLDRSPVYQADLEAVRAASGDYLSLLSANTRSQIRRAIKDHNGLPTVTAASTTGEAVTWLDEMRALNEGRHEDNAWSDPAFCRFLLTLARKGIPSGEVELLRFTDDGGPVGLLVNFIHRGQALNYQSAFAAPRTAKDKPGLLCHTAAVAHYVNKGLTLYSLLAGKDRYKQSLAIREEALEWWILERFSPALEAEALLRRLLKRPASA